MNHRSFRSAASQYLVSSRNFGKGLLVSRWRSWHCCETFTSGGENHFCKSVE